MQIIACESHKSRGFTKHEQNSNHVRRATYINCRFLVFSKNKKTTTQ